MGKGVRGANRKLGAPAESPRQQVADGADTGEGMGARLRARKQAWSERRAAKHSARAEGLALQGDDQRPNWPRRLATASLRLGTVGALAWGLAFAGQEVYDYSTTSARFETKHFIFEPTEHVDDDTLRELLAIEAGTNILALEPVELGERILEHPWVAQATVVRELPDTLEITVVEHEPAAIVLAERFWLVDAAGAPFKEVERGERGELPIITGISKAELAAAAERADALASQARAAEQAGAVEASAEAEAEAQVDPKEPSVELGTDAVARAMAVVELYAAKQRPRLGEVHLDSDGSVTLYTAESGTQLRLGRDEFDARLERWDALRVALGPRADALAVVHLDHESKPDRRDRVVARFADAKDEAVLLAQANDSQEDSSRSSRGSGRSASSDQASAADPAERPAARAGRRDRIPRYE
ncbi:cell division protein FtsQ [Plesiocystis pacifica SIR-1]|uniref:Cell division protein FtsQ n=1 Tax=Plesiocystis pacifica SIR-1 TaxID=391625 RepID=A6G8B9_9BACT|nr:cell division protein FtsQ [Plesiocystis pacifica SIR-1]